MSKTKQAPAEIEPDPCPFCGSEQWEITDDDDTCAIYCETCGAVGPYAANTHNATRLWNLRA